MKQPIPPATVAAFYGVDAPNVEDPFANRPAARDNGYQEQDEDTATAIFFGVDNPKSGLKLGQPIPGYSGVNRRVEADNVFGMTYAEACRRAKES